MELSVRTMKQEPGAAISTCLVLQKGIKFEGKATAGQSRTFRRHLHFCFWFLMGLLATCAC